MIERIALLLLLLLAVVPLFGANTIQNDDSCDLAVLPAATLLLPYFEVDLDRQNGETTLLSVTNVTNLDRIAHVTLWTDRAYPVLSFNVYLTGYDVQAFNLYDILVRGVIAPERGGTGTQVSPKRGTFADPNPALDLTGCTRLPGALDAATVTRMQTAFTEGKSAEAETVACNGIGGHHDRAIGYATIDVVGACTSLTPVDELYWTSVLRYDNVFIGDYHQVNGAENYAQGGPLVHIRAIPEGGTPAMRTGPAYDSGFRQTFYGRYQPEGRPLLDARQPLPSHFATRWIEGSSSSFRTSLKIWREGEAIKNEPCSAYASNGDLDATEIVVFDENENAVGSSADTLDFPAVSRLDVSDADRIPQMGNGAVGGWMYLNLDRNWREDGATQNWVVSSMRAQGRFSTDTDAIALGNGCSPDQRPSEITRSTGGAVAPARNFNGGELGVAAVDNDASCDVAALPAATLLLPYFEVDLDSTRGENTLLTVTNVSASDQIARVTLWTDFGYAVTSFNLFLTGYDVQSLSMYDVLASGVTAPGRGTGSSVSPRGAHSEPNTRLALDGCARLPQQLGPDMVKLMAGAFLEGSVPASAGLAACDEVGLMHDNAVGYVTIDLVRNCSTNGPMTPEYWTDDLAYDNVLIGDYQQLNGANNFAQGNAMVHVRAIPEGGTQAQRLADPDAYSNRFPHTFYSRYQAPKTPMLDGRQPLPSTFAARWIQGSANTFATDYKIWREGKTGINALCGVLDDNFVKMMEIVRFDEQENGVGDVPVSRICTPITIEYSLPSTSRTSVADTSIYPELANGAIGGWMYFNLDNCQCDLVGSQNWVMTSMRAEGRFSTEGDAAAMGNGCGYQTPVSEVTIGSAIIAPAPNHNR